MLIKTSQRVNVPGAKKRSEDPFLESYRRLAPPSLGRRAIDTVAGSATAAHLSQASLLINGLKALPGFAYPTLVGATPAEKALIYQTLDGLPLSHVGQVSTISVLDDVSRPFRNESLGGYAQSLGFANPITIGRHANQGIPDVTRHEVGHVADWGDGDLLWFKGRSRHEPFGHGPFHTGYAETNRREDFADSYKDFHGNPSELRRLAPEKYGAMEAVNKQTWLQSLVDREEFRETGKALGELGQGNSAARHTAQALVSATSLVQVGYGVSQWLASPQERTAESHAAGILNTLSGAIMLTGVAPLLSVGLQGGLRALQSGIAGKRLTPEEVESVVSLPFRPLERAMGMETVEIAEDHRPIKVLAVGAGGAAGGAAGALAGPFLGVLAGYHLAGGIGGAIGLAIGGLGGFTAGSYLGGRLGDALS